MIDFNSSLMIIFALIIYYGTDLLNSFLLMLWDEEYKKEDELIVNSTKEDITNKWI